MYEISQRVLCAIAAACLLTLVGHRAVAEDLPQPKPCDPMLTKLANAQAQEELDTLDSDLDEYSHCGPLQLDYQRARVRVGRNTLLAISRQAELATSEADLTKLRDGAQASVNQVEDAYVRLMGGAEGGTVQLACVDTKENEENEQNGRLSRPKFPARTGTRGLTNSEVIDVQTQTCEARKLKGDIAFSVRWRRLAAANLCGGFNADGGVTRVCVTYGAFSAALSTIWFLDGAPDGLKGGRLLSVLVPYAGGRIIPFQYVPYLSLDLILYSAYITSGSVETAPAATACGGGGNALLQNLPCETNPVIQPFAAFMAGVTLGRDNIGYLTLAPLTIGFAKVGSQGVHPYIGMLAGTLQLTGRF